MRVILCPHCSEPYSLYLFEFGIPFWCRCGYILGAPEELEAEEVVETPPDLDPTDEFDPAEDEFLFEDYPEDPPFYDDGASTNDPNTTTQDTDVGGDFRAQFEARIRDLGNRDRTETVAEEASEREKLGEIRSEELRRRADRICFLISSTDYSQAEIEVEQDILKIRCQRYFPEMRDAYEHVYEPRFEKLWREFREE